MKSFFENKINKNNPFAKKDNNKGDETNTMAEDNKETEEIQETANQEENITEEKEAETETAEKTEEPEKTELELLQEKYDNLNNQYIRLAADFDNFRKRQIQEREALITFGATECMKKVLEVADNFDRALDMVDK
ncbi:nucleotide exchange factor GrpE, partial [bacterium]|nr:nucleotide exchange factor GrpE [bacterium]